MVAGRAKWTRYESVIRVLELGIQLGSLRLLLSTPVFATVTLKFCYYSNEFDPHDYPVKMSPYEREEGDINCTRGKDGGHTP